MNKIHYQYVIDFMLHRDRNATGTSVTLTYMLVLT